MVPTHSTHASIRDAPDPGFSNKAGLIWAGFLEAKVWLDLILARSKNLAGYPAGPDLAHYVLFITFEVTAFTSIFGQNDI